MDESGNYGQCDFEGDGVTDRFFATGQTWWYSSGGTGPWAYLNTSTKRRSELALGDFDSDGRCDVKAGSVISKGGTGPGKLSSAASSGRTITASLAVWSMDRGRSGRTLPGSRRQQLADGGTGDFDGDRNDDILWQQTTGQVAIWFMRRGSRVGRPTLEGRCRGLAIQGVGDFDGDGSSDILWRNADGQLAIWFRGDPVTPLTRPPTRASTTLPRPSIWRGR